MGVATLMRLQPGFLVTNGKLSGNATMGIILPLLIRLTKMGKYRGGEDTGLE